MKKLIALSLLSVASFSAQAVDKALCEKEADKLYQSTLTKGAVFSRGITFDCDLMEQYLRFDFSEDFTKSFVGDLEKTRMIEQELASDELVKNNCVQFADKSGLFSRFGTKIYGYDGELIISNMVYLPNCEK